MTLKAIRRPGRTKYAALAIAIISNSNTGVWLTNEANDKTDEYLVASVALPAGSQVVDAAGGDELLVCSP